MFLIFLLIGLPAAARYDVGRWEIRNQDQVHHLIAWAGALAAILNLAAARWLVSRRKDRWVCWQWVIIYGLISSLEIMIIFNWVHFDWLRDWLKSLGKMMG